LLVAVVAVQDSAQQPGLYRVGLGAQASLGPLERRQPGSGQGREILSGQFVGGRHGYEAVENGPRTRLLAQNDAHSEMPPSKTSRSELLSL
jgi:hypothetical protein